MAALLAGALVIVLVLQDAFEVMLLPRRVKRRYRITSAYFRFAWAGWVMLARVLSPGPRQERFLGNFGPLSMTLLFAFWAIGLIAGFGLVQWSAQQIGGLPPAVDLAGSLYLSGVTFFTLGYGDIVPKTPPGQFAAVVEAGVGFGLIAVVIGYLPVLYQLFSRRETHVIQLDGRAGSAVQLNDVRLPPGKQLVQHRQISDDHCDQPKADARFHHRCELARGRLRNDVAVAEGKKGDAAEVEAAGQVHGRRQAADLLSRPLHQAKSGNEADGPECEQQGHREGAEVAKKAFLSRTRRKDARQHHPPSPGESKIRRGNSVAALHPPRKQHHLEGVLQHQHDHQRARKQRRHDAHGLITGKSTTMVRFHSLAGKANGFAETGFSFTSNNFS